MHCVLLGQDITLNFVYKAMCSRSTCGDGSSIQRWPAALNCRCSSEVSVNSQSLTRFAT